MLNIDVLKEYGANTDEGISRCMGKEDFYLMLVGKVINDKRLTALESQLKEKDLTAAFEKAASKAGWSGIKNIVSGLFLIATTLFFGYFASGLDELKYRKAEPDPEQSA